MSITSTLDNASAASAKLGKIGGDLTPLFREIATALEKNFDKRFDARKDPDGKSWMPWADSTAAQRKRQGKGKLLEFSNPGMRDMVMRRYDAKGASLDMFAPYAKFHEQTERPGDGRLPRRAMLFSKAGGLGAMDQKTVETATENYFKRLLT